MIITSIGGGLGNQLFQYACGRALAYKLNTELKLDISECLVNPSLRITSYRLGDFNINENFATTEEIESLQTFKEERVNGVPGVFMPKIFDAPDNICLNGNWQSEKYFSDIADTIRREYTLKNPLGEVSKSWHEKILSAECAVSLHIRHGDYFTPIFRSAAGILPMDYYTTSVEELKKDFPNLTLFVFSNDLTWAKENLNFGVSTEFVEGCERDAEEIYLMSQCKHNIVSQGTFAWWGAWLNSNPDKKVFAPYPWQRGGWGGETIIPEGWIKVPVNYDRNPHVELPPILSIIIYVENDAKTIAPLIGSALTQQIRDYEVVVIDASTDGSGEFCRRFAGNLNVNFVRTSRSIGKFAAWNLGAECARGEYVLFLTGKDFILTHTAFCLANVWEWFYNRNLDNKADTFMTKNYGKHSPNIICATQRISEDAAGTLGIEGFPDRKFAIQTDAPFQNLRETTELKIDSAQKLILLATNQLNTLLGTKFFKRAFLVENKIRFDENFGADTELMFLISAFMHTEKITFVPQLFYGRLN